MVLPLRLYWRHDMDLICLASMPGVDMIKCTRMALLAYATKQKDFLLHVPEEHCSGVKCENMRVGITLNPSLDDDRKMISLWDSLSAGTRNSAVKTIIRMYLDRPVLDVFFPDEAPFLVDRSLYDGSIVPSPILQESVPVRSQMISSLRDLSVEQLREVDQLLKDLREKNIHGDTGPKKAATATESPLEAPGDPEPSTPRPTPEKPLKRKYGAQNGDPASGGGPVEKESPGLPAGKTVQEEIPGSAGNGEKQDEEGAGTNIFDWVSQAMNSVI